MSTTREPPQAGRLPSVLPWPALVIAATAFAAVAPMLSLGIPSGHDFEFHLDSWIEVVGQWRQGIIYPRWAALAHYGYGEARFIFYPPASWTLGSLLGTVLPWNLVPGAFVWIGLSASGFAMFFCARRWLPNRAAIFAAAFYTATSYHLVIVYWRSALAELLAGSLVPLLLLFALGVVEEGRRMIVPLALVVAATWLTNAPSAVMANYSLALLAVVVAVIRRSPRVLLYVGIALVAGAALASFYLIPAVYEEKWVNIAQVLSPGVRPQDNFLFTAIKDPDHDRFNVLVSIVACAETVLAGAAAFLSRKTRSERPELWWSLVLWSAAAAILMFPFMLFFWEHLPKLRFVQLPWRWLLCLDAGVAMLLPLAWRRWPARTVLSLALLALLVFLAHNVQPPWWDHADDISEIRDNIRDGAGYEGTDEYVPSGADPYEIKQGAPQVEAEHGVQVRVVEWEAESKAIEADARHDARLVLRLFNYPAWVVTVNGARTATDTTDVTGQMVIPLARGRNRVQITFVRTWDRTLGGAISLIMLVLVGAVYIRDRRSKDQGRTSNGRMRHILIATSNKGKLRDFSGAAKAHGVEVAELPNFSGLPVAFEDGQTFEENARKKAEFYSRFAPGELVLADDSGLEVDALGGAPGVHSARYAADEPHKAETNTDDDANNERVLRELQGVAPEKRTGRFVCIIAAARDGRTVAIFRGVAEGVILDRLRGTGGFGYDPMFFFPAIQKTFAELTPEEKARYSHRGAAFRSFLSWYDQQQDV